MFVMNFKLTRKKILTAAVAAVGIAVIILIGGMKGGRAEGKNPGETESEKVSIAAETEEERQSFLDSFGYKTSGEAEESADVIIPYNFDATYEAYNQIQKEQGYNLKDYSGCMVKRYTYEITNYDDSDTIVYANILVDDGKVIGGDVCSAELDGFMHGFKKP